MQRTCKSCFFKCVILLNRILLHLFDFFITRKSKLDYKLNYKSLGNHEFDNGVSGLVPFIKDLKCPVLAANLILAKVPELANETNLRKYIIINISGTRIGIIGYLTPDTKIHTMKNEVDYIDEIVAIQEEANKLLEDGVNIIIALGHSGYLKDQQIAKEVEGVDLVIGGHSHSFLWNDTIPEIEESDGPYPTYVTQASGKLVPVVQAYAYTKYLGRINLIFDSDGELIHADGTPILLDKTIPQDSEIVNILERYRTDIESIIGDIVGKTTVLLDGMTCDKKECNLGNLITDSMVHYYAARYKGEHWTDVPIGILQAGGIRASIAHAQMPANVTKGDLLTVMPFKGPLATILMNGTVLLQMLEHSVSNYEEPRVRHFLQFSGLRVVYNYSEPLGNRVVSAIARCWACIIPEYFKVETKQIYKIIMPAIIAQGGDGYWMLKDLPHEVLNYNEVNCTMDYVQKTSPIFPEIGGRIIIHKKESQEALKGSSSTAFPSLSISVIALMTLI